MDNRIWQKYRRRSEIRTFEPFAPVNKPAGAVVIPALAETDFLPATLHRLAQCDPASHAAAVVIVVNRAPETAGVKAADNARTLAALRSGDREFCGGLTPGRELFWIDADAPGKQLTATGGVGEARKIGMDSCLDFFTPETGSESLLFCLDADTLVSENYLAAARAYFHNHRKTSAVTVNFSHQAGQTAAENAAIEQYERFMRYYVRGLEFAGSPYAFYALGSAIICRAEAYIRAGGMRPRNGGEDFYFLQAVSKFGNCGRLETAVVRPAARPSDRVPFGTGPKIREILAGRELRFYHPEIFRRLKTLLDTVNTLTNPAEFAALPALLERQDGAEAREFLRRQDFAGVWEKIFRNTPRETFYLKKAFHVWFDAFRTLKFIHFCENHYPSLSRVSYAAILAAGFFSPRNTRKADF
ncbi:MAG: hypothetical protein PHH77_10155 [Victivallaceae bacterium]|nr:hypothetical protein [Victivallaceae bacterium]